MPKIRAHCRIIEGLIAASLSPPPPHCKPRKKPRGAKGRGLKYEAKVAQRLQTWLAKKELFGELLVGQWFRFRDDFGQGCCQPDILLIQPNVVYIIEAKLTQTINAHMQLRLLYKPVVEMVYKRPVVLIQVCKNMVSKPSAGLVQCISEVFAKEHTSQIYTWHFMGEEPLGGWK